MRFIAQEVREHHGRSSASARSTRWSAASIGSSRARPSTTGRRRVSTSPTCSTSPRWTRTSGRYCQDPQEHGLEKALDITTLLAICAARDRARRGGGGGTADPQRQPRGRHDHRQRDHAATRCNGPARRHDPAALPAARAGQSFGAFIPPGMTLSLEGDANDYVGKGLSRRQDHRVPAARGRASPRSETSSSATWPCTARRRARPTSAAWPASGSASATAASTRWSKASATMAANT